MQLRVGTLSLKQAEWKVDHDSSLNAKERAEIKQRLHELEGRAAKRASG